MTPPKNPGGKQGHKKTYFLLFFSFALFAFFAGCVKQEIKNIDSKGRNIVCFGDSITFGYGAAAGQDYPSVLSKMLDMPVINSGTDGETSSEALFRLKDEALDKDPLLVIIELGGNDFLKKIPMETTIKNIKEIIERIQARGAMVAVVDISAGFFLKDYRAAFKKIAQEGKAIFVPAILKGIITNPSMKSDFLHPNENGYKLIAQRIYRKILPYLKEYSHGT